MRADKRTPEGEDGVVANPPRVLNKHAHGLPSGAVYVGRPSKWGNPFTHLPGTQAKYQVGSREEAVTAYRQWLDRMLAKDPGALARIRAELGGRDLVCWCAPRACHADVLLELANAPESAP